MLFHVDRLPYTTREFNLVGPNSPAFIACDKSLWFRPLARDSLLKSLPVIYEFDLNQFADLSRRHDFGFHIYTTIYFTDEFSNVSVTLRVGDANVSVTEVDTAVWAWWHQHTLSIEKQTWI